MSRPRPSAPLLRTSVTVTPAEREDLETLALHYKATLQDVIRSLLLLAAIQPPPFRQVTTRRRLGEHGTQAVNLDEHDRAVVSLLVPRYFATLSAAVGWALREYAADAALRSLLQDPYERDAVRSALLTR